MRIIDLSHTIESGMPVFPGTEPPVIEPATSIAEDGFLENKIIMYSHTGTHIDAPAHMLKDGLTLDRFPIDKFLGKAAIIDLSNVQGKEIAQKDLVRYEPLLATIDFLILKTGWSRYWGTDSYFQGHPALTVEGAEWLSGFPLKGVGTDAISIDSMDSKDFAVHYAFFAKDWIIIENLTNLDLINDNSFIFSCLPLKTGNADGSPTRAVAIINQ